MTIKRKNDTILKSRRGEQKIFTRIGSFTHNNNSIIHRWDLMIDPKKDRRRFHRLFFTMEDDITATFAFSDLQKGLLTAHIINLSEGGLGLALSKHEVERIWKGDYLILSHIKGIKGLESLINVKLQIKWILDNQTLEFIGCGCQFFDLPQSTQEKIRMFIDAWHRRNIARPSRG